MLAVSVNFGASSERCPYYGKALDPRYAITCGNTSMECMSRSCFDQWDGHMYDLAQKLCAITSSHGIPYHQWNKGGIAWNRCACGSMGLALPAPVYA